MKTINILKPLLLCALCIPALSSCYISEAGVYQESYRTSRGSYEGDYYPTRGRDYYEPGERVIVRDGYRDPYYRDRGYVRSRRGYDYDRNFRYDSYDRRSHRGRGYDDRYDNRRKKSSEYKKQHGEYKVVGGSTGSKKKPKDYHSIDWFKKRGYDVNKLKLKNRSGKIYKKQKKR